MHLSTISRLFIHLFLQSFVNLHTAGDYSFCISLSRFSKDKMPNNLALYAKIVYFCMRY